jgi:glycosyltransferase involved in cell wall biosynthesis
MNPLTWFRTARHVRRLDFDLIVVAYWTGLLAPLCVVMGQVTGLKTVVLLHNFTSHEKIPAEKLLKRLLVASADGFITMSESVSRELRAFSASVGMATLFHPVYEPEGEAPSMQDARRSMGISQSSKVLLFFGYVREYKGLDTLFEAMVAVLQQEPSARLVVAGEFILDVARFHARARTLGIAGSVDIQPGYVPAERVGRLFAAADAVVLPYRSATQSGIVPLAFGHGVPVIACDAGALGSQISHGRTGWIVERPGASALAEGILDFFRSRDRVPFREGIAAARAAISWKAFATEAAAFLENFKRRVA